ncbi:uncharacterized protein AB675_6159 [Cyphellophora attinorum]|uniref:Xaa-Pro dipeptidyl-peptidase C-terminal domain-containing protein n=1 Tax=Cyphellophora attinorum TaxID=1664694 RepID=A0A0N1P0T3_9EURO|nr:uncharacterized protein AB675_6159 [Phialophora attinorum]KPI43802.1 hypothetical protein AB675_6159 [Phialophora attinorum]
MPNPLRVDLHRVDSTSFDYVYEENVTIELQEQRGIVRANVYRPKPPGHSKCPVLVTYGPYGKDVHYSVFHAESFAEVPAEHHSPHSAWETPDPGFWTRHGYAIVRADEVGLGQSPGILNTMSRDTSLAFKDVIEWAADQPWSSGKVGLLGISYYAGSQWRVAARRPRGLACIIPWEGMSDYYRDRCRHGGILSNTFIGWWWNRQVIVNQYGRGGRAARKWGPDTLEGNLSEEELAAKCHDQTVDNVKNRFLDDEYYATTDYDMSDIEVPLLSVGNWGGILLHLRGNVEGFVNAGSRHKYLRFVTGRHDLPFYTKEYVDLQLSFLNAFLKGDDPMGWSRGEQPKVRYRSRIGDVGFNDAVAEAAYPERDAEMWPIPTTQYTKYYMTPGKGLQTSLAEQKTEARLSYKALGDLKNQHLVQFVSDSFTEQVEFTGHIVARLNVSVTVDENQVTQPSDIDLFVTLRHLDQQDKEILYTGTVGDPVPIAKGWLRVSLRAINEKSSRCVLPWHPHREYRSTDHSPLTPGEVYQVDVEVWPTNVVFAPGDKLVFEVSSGDTQGAGLFEHNSKEDRDSKTFAGINHIHFGPSYNNWVLMPVVPSIKA